MSAIFLGAPKVNLPTKYLPVDLPFVCELEGITNLRPLPGEPRLFRDGEGEYYAAIIRLSAVQGLGEILVVASMQTEGTWGAVEYLVQPAHIKELLGRIKRSDGSFPSKYQVLVRIKMVEQVPILAEYVTHRELP